LVERQLKILLLGKHGQLGWELRRTLAPLGPLTVWDYEDVDLRDAPKVREKVRDLAPQVIVNAAAYTDVDRAESESALAFAVNAVAPGVLAEEARNLGASLIHYSTDYVFDGKKGQPYTEADSPNPINVYGSSKLAGEQAVQTANGSYLILRTAWVYSRRRNSFVNKVLHWARRHQQLRIVDDQISNPTWARLLAESTALLLAQAHADAAAWMAERKGVYHWASQGYASRLEWAKLILELDPMRSEQVVEQVLPASTAEFSTPAKRPLFSALDCARFIQTFDLQNLPWADALRLALVEN
jgi:dTDP-4-dehydrorhamnose reductase